MKYMVEDTYNGYRLSMLDNLSLLNNEGFADGLMGVRHHFDEPGGHGPIEEIYARADQAWDELRSKESA